MARRRVKSDLVRTAETVDRAIRFIKKPWPRQPPQHVQDELSGARVQFVQALNANVVYRAKECLPDLAADELRLQAVLARLQLEMMAAPLEKLRDLAFLDECVEKVIAALRVPPDNKGPQPAKPIGRNGGDQRPGHTARRLRRPSSSRKWQPRRRRFAPDAGAR